MHRSPSKEDGITLIELLATLAILSILIVLTYSVLLSGFNSSKKSNENVTIQQEMNLVAQSITKFHETHTSYEIKVDKLPYASKIILTGVNDDGVVNTLELSNTNFEYSLYDFSVEPDGVPFNNPHTIANTSSDSLFIKIIIRNKNNSEQKYELKTIISRI